MEEFKGFSTPNFTQTPNEFFDIIQSKDISKSEIKILAFMVRMTFGWQRAGFSLQFTFSEIQEQTQMGRQQVRDGLHKCMEKGYIERAEITGSLVYRLKMDSEMELPWDLKFEWQKVAKKKEEESSDTMGESQQFENQTNSSLKIKPSAVLKSNRDQFENQTDKNVESVDIPKTKQRLNKSLNKRLNKSLNKSQSVIDSEAILKFIDGNEKLLDRLTDIETIYLSVKNEKGYSDSLLISTLEKAANAKIKNSFAQYLLKAMINNLSQEADKSKKNDDLPEWIAQQEVAGTTEELSPEQKKQAEELLRALGEID